MYQSKMHKLWKYSALGYEIKMYIIIIQKIKIKLYKKIVIFFKNVALQSHQAK